MWHHCTLKAANMGNLCELELKWGRACRLGWYSEFCDFSTAWGHGVTTSRQINNNDELTKPWGEGVLVPGSLWKHKLQKIPVSPPLHLKNLRTTLTLPHLLPCLRKPKEVISRTEYVGPGLDVIVFVTAGQLFTDDCHYLMQTSNKAYCLQLN